MKMSWVVMKKLIYGGCIEVFIYFYKLLLPWKVNAGMVCKVKRIPADYLSFTLQVATDAPHQQWMAAMLPYWEGDCRRHFDMPAMQPAALSN